jgi:peptidoglycan-associated lipoprotein
MKRVIVIGLTLALVAGCTAPDEVPPGPSGAGAGAGIGAGATGDTGLGPPTGASSGFDTSDLPAGVVPGSQEDLEVSVGDTVLFDYDSAVLNSRASGILDRQAAWLQGYPDTSVTVEGHADERGTREYNLALGDRRANAVRNYLVALDVAPSRILTISYGEERPVDPANNDAAYAQNRRAVTVVNTVN